MQTNSFAEYNQGMSKRFRVLPRQNSPATLRQRIGIHARQFLILWLVTFAVLLLYIAIAPAPDGGVSRLYLWLLPSYYFVLLALLAAIALPFALHRFLTYPLAIAMWCWLMFMVINFAVFNLYGFHLDLLFIEMFFLDFRGLGLPWPLLVSVFALGIFLGVVVIWIIKYAAPDRKRSMVMNRLVVLCLVLGFPLFLAGQAIHAWGARFDIPRITQYTPYFPFFFPVTSSRTVDRLAARFPELAPAPSAEGSDQAYIRDSSGRPAGRVQYPKAPLECSAEKKPNIVLVVVESWQADTVNPKVMPNTWQLSQQAHFYRQHISSGAATVAGFFGLMYGLHPSYYTAFRAQARQYPSPLTETAFALGYRTRVFSSGDFERFSLRTMFFSRVNDADFHMLATDEAVIQKAQTEIAQHQDKTPTLDIIFLTSSHSPYRYPASHQRFNPVPAIKGAYAINKNIDPLPFRNDYFNSLYYVDDLLGGLWRTLQKAERFDPSWIVLTGDHSEEFNETGLGFWGHGSNFSRWQTGTPLLVKPALNKERRVIDKVSLHQDIAPTLLRHVFGCKNPIADYSNGESLFELPESRQTVIASYSTQAYFVDGMILERQTGKKYDWQTMRENPNRRIESDRLRLLREEETRFSRSP